jgi:two-component system, NtrC family, response regulator GlrR
MTLPVRILGVDDDANLRQTLALILEHAGYVVTSSASAREGLCCLEKQPFDLVFLDLAMPELDGLTFLPQLHQQYPHIPVMILTGNALPEPTMELEAAGISGYLSKPVDPEQILAQVLRLTVDKNA